MQINGEDVRCASHEHVVDLIRSSGSLVTMDVISQMYPNNFQQQQQQVSETIVFKMGLFWRAMLEIEKLTNILHCSETATAVRINDKCSTMCNITA